ncbi:MAG: hypothetical protein J6R54_01615 [Bacteroidaceae bacterium]|nr:hypothetical protein [Bacteroidaceae bacterium]
MRSATRTLRVTLWCFGIFTGCFISAWDSRPSPVGLASLAVAVGEDESTIEDVHEPFLIMQGYIKRTPRGREAMPAAYRKVGANLPGGQTQLPL